jgi:hypothetical protein
MNHILGFNPMLTAPLAFLFMGAAFIAGKLESIWAILFFVLALLMPVWSLIDVAKCGAFGDECPWMQAE